MLGICHKAMPLKLNHHSLVEKLPIKVGIGLAVNNAAALGCTMAGMLSSDSAGEWQQLLHLLTNHLDPMVSLII